MKNSLLLRGAAVLVAVVMFALISVTARADRGRPPNIHVGLPTDNSAPG